MSEPLHRPCAFSLLDLQGTARISREGLSSEVEGERDGLRIALEALETVLEDELAPAGQELEGTIDADRLVIHPPRPKRKGGH